jgi:hypothetical protein
MFTAYIVVTVVAAAVNTYAAYVECVPTKSRPLAVEPTCHPTLIPQEAVGSSRRQPESP